MSLSNKLAHARYVLINRLATPLSSFILLMLIAKKSDVLLGEYAVVMAFYFVMQMLPLLGLTTYVMREVAREPQQAGKYFISIGFLSIVSCFIVDLVIYSIVRKLGYSSSIETGIFILSILIIPGIIIFICELIIMSLHRARIVGNIAIIENIFRILVSLIVLYRGGDLEELMYVFLISRLCTCISYIVIMIKVKILTHLELPDFHLLAKTIKLLPAFFIGTLLLALVGRLDFFVLSLTEELSIIGYYAIGYRVLEISIVILSGLIMAIFPYLSKKFLSSGLHFKVALRIILQMFAIGLSVYCFICLLYAQYYVYILFSNQYPHPLLVTQLFILVLLITGIDHLSSSLLHASDMQVKDTKVLAIGGIVYAGLLMWLVPVLGMIGAILVRTITSILQVFLKISAIQACIGKIWTWGDLVKLITFVSTLIVLDLYLLNLNFFIKTLMVLIVVFFLVPLLLFILNIFQPIRILRFYWKNKNRIEPKCLSDLIDIIVSDFRRHKLYSRSIDKKTKFRHRLDRGQIAVLNYRVCNFLLNKGYIKISKSLSCITTQLTSINIVNSSIIGPGFVLFNPGKMFISVIAGKNLTCLGSNQIGKNCEKIPIFGNNFMIESGTYSDDET